MATLISPGVSVDIINESFYGTAGAGTVPLIVIATASNKVASSGVGIAPLTAPAKAENLFLATSQLELASNFGVPYFASYQGTIVQGNETNEWGLHAAYSYLGISNRAYILRADIDTAQLEPSALPPVGAPVAGQYWLDLSSTKWGVFKANGNVQPGLAWTPKAITIPTISQVDVNNIPLASFGIAGDIAVVPWTTDNFFYEKGVVPGDSTATWHLVGSAGWATLFPTIVRGSVTQTAIIAGHAILINGSLVTITGAGSNATLTETVTAINGAAISNIVASIVNNALVITNTSGENITLADVSNGGVLAAVGIVAKTYAGVTTVRNSGAQYPDGSVVGSIWVKGNSSRNGAAWSVKYYNGATAQFITLSAPFYPFNSALSDSTNGKDTAATAALGSPTAGSVYIGYDAATGVQQIRRWNGNYWTALSYVADLVAPTTAPVAGTYWYDRSSSFAVDVMVSNGNEWKGYRNTYPNTDINGVQISATAPTTQTNGNALVANDLWMDSSDEENYPAMYRWDASATRWRAIDKTDHSSPFGIIFNDTRQDTGVSFTGIANSVNYSFSSTVPADLALSDFVDPDAPNPELYPAGLIVFNTRASNNTVKVWRPDYFRAGASPVSFDPNDDYTVNAYTVGNTSFVFPAVASAGRWVNAAGNDSANHLLPFMGRKAQRQMIVRALREAIDNNQEIRAETVHFNLIACPGYCELIESMTTLNVDQKQVSFIVGDTPMRLDPSGTSLINWANNAKNVGYTSEDGLAPGAYSGELGDYIGLYYPWGLGTDVTGNEVMVPPSTIALRTIAYNDQVAYQWFAPAGFTRGLVSNASSVGYLNKDGSFTPVILNQGQRDVLYGARPTGCQINPIAYIPGRGLVVYGQKTLSGNATALDRINVARLVNYLRYELDILVKIYLFEQNDSHTRTSAKHTVEAFLNSLVGFRAITDYAVKCDSDNNTPDRIDRNELWIDVAIRPIRSVEFIHVPVRILNSSTQPISL